MIVKSHRWQLTAVTVAALTGLWATHANALSLGRVFVQSSLGEALKAEIEILDINADEAASLSARVAPPESFKSAGLDYNPVMANLRAKLARRANGQAYLQISSDRPVNDPFVDMILEANWSSGRIVRDYTMLFDPPNLRQTAAVPPTLAQVPIAALPDAITQRPATALPAQTTKPAAAVVPAPARAKAKPAQTTTPPSPAPAAQRQEPKPAQVNVKAGDTAGRIAVAHKPESVSLDQMLVAMLRTNPDAFIGDNINRIKAGAVVTLPTEDQASATSAEQAQKIIFAQSSDFNTFRRQLADHVPTTPTNLSARAVSGKIEASVKDSKPQVATPDKLTLTKGSVTAHSSEDQLANANNDQAIANRKAELSKNIQELNKLAASSSGATKPAAPTSGPIPNLDVHSPMPTSAPLAQASAPTAAASLAITPPVLAASAPAAVASAAATSQASAPRKPVSKPVLAPPAPVTEPSFVDTLLENPLLPLGAGGLIALLAGFAFYKVRQRKKTAALDSSFLESRLNPESFFGASGGQNVDTNDNPVTGSSMIYSPSQLDAVDDVDPVAEADVYLAYGRDLQAEEILKDALRSNPNRLAIHQKLLEIYAKRGDTKTFEAIATLAFNLTNGTGQDWEQVCEKGLAIDPDNVLYLPGGQPQAVPSASTSPTALETSNAITDHGADDLSSEQLPPATDLDLDLDLDFSLDEPAPEAGSNVLPPVEPAAAMPRPQANEPDFSTEPLPSLSMEPLPFDMPESAPQPAPVPSASNELLSMDSLDFSLPDAPESPASDGFNKTQTLDNTSAATPPAQPDSGMLEFDLSSLSLHLDDEPITESGAMPNAIENPLETKLALAEEFKAIGDDDGARALIEEVIAEAAGEIKTKAQRALKQL